MTLVRWPRLVAMAIFTSLPLTGALAQSPRTYAVLSLSADSITLVSPQITTGSMLDRNIRHVVELPDDSLDIAAVKAAKQVINEMEPAAVVELYASRDAQLLQIGNDGSVDRDVVVSDVVRTVRSVLTDSKATHLVLITKHRDEARFQLDGSMTGVGKLFGVGYYIDERKRLIAQDGRRMEGFVGPFASLKAQLIDLQKIAVVRQATHVASAVHATAPGADTAWESLNAEKKAAILEQAVRKAVTSVTQRVLDLSLR